MFKKQAFLNNNLCNFNKHRKFFGQKTAWKNGKIFKLTWKPPPEVAIDEEKLNFFISKVTIWDYFSLSEQIYKSSSIEEKTSLLNKYYRELYEKYYGVCNFVFF